MNLHHARRQHNLLATARNIVSPSTLDLFGAERRRHLQICACELFQRQLNPVRGWRGRGSNALNAIAFAVQGWCCGGKINCGFILLFHIHQHVYASCCGAHGNNQHARSQWIKRASVARSQATHAPAHHFHSAHA